MNPNTWKLIAITFILLFAIETTLFAFIYSLGADVINAENECSVNICGTMDDAFAYQYDSVSGVCYCLGSHGEVVEQRIIR